MRKLASVQTITALYPIPNKDRIVLAQIQGWQVIVKSSEFSVGDKCVFFEIDSFLPILPQYEFLGKNTTFENNPGYRIKTMKMAGVVSQGLALPLSMFNLQDLPEDTDLTDQLGITKYDRTTIQERTMKVGKARGNFPSFIPKTDQTRLQSLMSYFDIHKDTVFEETLKLDGSSLTAYKVQAPTPWYKRIFGITSQPHFGVCSRNVDLARTADKVMHFDNDGKTSTYDQSDFWSAAYKYDLESKIPVGYAVQGELIGPKIQSNWEKVHSLEFYCFDIYNIIEQRYLTASERTDFCSLYKIPHVPVTYTGPIFQECPSIEAFLARVDTESMNPGTISEGRVYKSTHNPNITFKCINNKYLLKEH